MRKFVIGDIHGCYQTLIELLYNQLKINRNDDIYFLGDYIDRGPRSKEVIDEIMKLMSDNYKIFPLMGNHELMLLESQENEEKFELWLYNSAQETLRSFNIMNFNDLEQRYKTFFKNLQYYFILDNYIIVHGGLNFRIDNPLADRLSMVWTRNEYIDTNKTGGRKLIVGHTPNSVAGIRKHLKTDKIMLDGGCVYKDRFPQLGNLVALELNSMELFIQPNIDF